MIRCRLFPQFCPHCRFVPAKCSGVPLVHMLLGELARIYGFLNLRSPHWNSELPNLPRVIMYFERISEFMPGNIDEIVELFNVTDLKMKTGWKERYRSLKAIFDRITAVHLAK